MKLLGEKREKNISETCQNSNYNITVTIKRISSKRIQCNKKDNQQY
jgi:hypothetical protein